MAGFAIGAFAGVVIGWQIRKLYTFHMWRLSRMFKERAKGRR